MAIKKRLRDDEIQTTTECRVKDLDEGLKKRSGNIKVPQYQRGISWSQKQRETLINSLINEYPFGCILLYEAPNNKYKIIDGLQRSYALIDFYSEPTKYFNNDFISENNISAMEELMNYPSSKELIRSIAPDRIINYVSNNYKTYDDLKKFSANEIAHEIVLELKNFFDDENNQVVGEGIQNFYEIIDELCKIIDSIVDNFIEHYKKICFELKIPVIIFKSKIDQLPEIFERINKEGSKLTKYQVYAASWSKDYVVIDRKEFDDIIQFVKKRYERYLKEIDTLDDYDSRTLERTKRVNLFDLVFGFGKMISKKYPNLFSFEPDVSKVDSVGFNLINACLLQKSKDLDCLNKVIKKYVGLDSKAIQNFLERIMTCIEEVNSKLGGCINFKSNKGANSTPSPLHSELQIVSIISFLFVLKHIEFEKNEDDVVTSIKYIPSKKTKDVVNIKNIFNERILKLYAMDLIGGNWKGSGDNKLYSIIISSNYYLRDCNWNDFSGVLDGYYKRQRSENIETTKVAAPTSQDKLILNLIYSNIFTARDQGNGSLYDIEHLASKDLMIKRIASFKIKDFGLPISSIANQCLLPKDYNEFKQQKVMYECPIYNGVNIIEDFEKKYTFTKQENFDWLIGEEMTNDADKFKQQYFEYLDDRFKNMMDKIQESMFPESIQK